MISIIKKHYQYPLLRMKDFFHLKRVKTYLRTTMGERLNDLMIFEAVKEEASNIDL